MSIQTSINDNSSLTMDLNDPLMIENLENCDQNSKNEDSDENKIQIEQHIIQLGCIKKEVDEEMCNFVNVDSKYQFSDIGTVIKEEAVELENVKQENMSIEVAYGDNSANISKQGDTCCNECGKEYNGYCNDCSSLTHFLNNSILSTNSNWKTKSIPIGVLEIKSTSDRNGVFALRTFPKSVIFGPFEGVSPVESTTGHMWKIKDRKLSNIENGNWMQYISTTGNAIFKNLDTFQFGGYLYYQTNREIHSGEELIVCYSEEEMQKSDNSDDYYYIPVNGNETQRLFACTLCGLGFSLEKCLNEHKLKCPHAKRNGSTKEIIECQFCNVWLEKQEYQEHHEAYCSKNHSRTSSFPSGIRPSEMQMDVSIDCSKKINTDDSDSSCAAIIDHTYCIPVHDLKTFQCDSCPEFFYEETALQYHIKFRHIEVINVYKCANCTYRTNRKDKCQRHAETYHKIVVLKPLETVEKVVALKPLQTVNKVVALNAELLDPIKCNICLAEFASQKILWNHRISEHLCYKCSECDFQTRYERTLLRHFESHDILAGVPTRTIVFPQ